MVGKETIISYLGKAQNHLGTYLNNLHHSAQKQQITVSSRWIGLRRITTSYPTSFGEHLIYFFKTLRWEIPPEAKQKLFKQTLTSLTIYQNAIKYEILASRPKWLYEEVETLAILLAKLETIQKDLKEQKTFNLDDHKEELLEWAGRIAEMQTSISPTLLLSIIKEKSLNRQSILIDQLKQNISDRRQEIPPLIEEAFQAANAHFHQFATQSNQNENSPLLTQPESLFNFFVKEKARAELIPMYQQVKKTAHAWNRQNTMDKQLSEQLLEIRQFFETTIHTYGPARDLTNGLAYTDLFKLDR
jgi:hypothetical protein